MNKFIEEIGPIIQAYAKQYGYKFPSAIIAQACLESNFGKSALSSNYFNYFGLKCGSSWRGKSVNMWTREEYHTGAVNIQDNFRVFNSMDDGVKGYFNFISTTRYKNLKDATSPRDYLTKIKADGYATASNYVVANMSVITNYCLERFDTTDIKTQKKATKNIKDIAQEVIQGKWGNGADRKGRLTVAGYNYLEVQAEVNRILRGGK